MTPTSRAPTNPRTRDGTWRNDALGALNATASILPFVLGYGFIAFGALGLEAAQIGLGAAAIAVVLGGGALAAFGASRLPAGCPSASTCVILGGTLQALATDPGLAASTAAGTALVLAAGTAIVLSAGLLMILLGALRAGSLVRFVPQPVLAGLMNGVAVLIVLSQLAPMLGLAPGALARDGARALAAWQGSALLVALLTAGLMAAAARRWPRVPAPLLALTAVGIAAWVWQTHVPGGSAGAPLSRIGPLAAAWPRSDAIARLLEPATWARLVPHLPRLGIGALVLALIGALESVLNLATVQQTLGEPADPNRELVATGAANLVSGVLGGLPVIYMRTRALATLRGGGRGPRSIWIGSGLMALVMTFGLPLIGRLSTAAVAGVAIVLALGLVDGWSRDLLGRWWAGTDRDDLRSSLGIMALVAAVMVVWGVAAGVGVGLGVSVIVFMRTLNRQLVRARYAAAEFPSRRVYAPADEAALTPLRAGIRVVELEGALFFGSAERLLDEADRAAGGAADVVLDLRRLTTIDASGAVALVQAGQRLDRLGVRLRLAGVRPDDSRDRTLRSHGAALVDGRWPDGDGGGLRIHPDVDRAVEAAELNALDRVAPEHAGRRVALADCQLLQGLTLDQFARLAPLFSERRLTSGERLFLEGEPGLAVYVITEGAISVIDSRRGQRFATLAPGMCFGETAVLDGAPRTADAVAEVDSVVCEISKERLEDLQHAAPEIAAQLYANLARHLSGRLRAASAGWRRAAE